MYNCTVLPVNDINENIHSYLLLFKAFQIVRRYNYLSFNKFSIDFQIHVGLFVNNQHRILSRKKINDPDIFLKLGSFNLFL